MNELATLRQHPDDDRLRQVCADAHLIGPRLALEVHSHINGHRAHVDYELVDFLDADSRRAP